MNCHLDILNCLLDNGANINLLSTEGLSALSACYVLLYTQQNFISNIAEDISTENLFNTVELEKKTGTIINRNDRKTIMAVYEKLFQPFGASPVNKLVKSVKSTARGTARRRKLSKLSSCSGFSTISTRTNFYHYPQTDKTVKLPEVKIMGYLSK